MDNDTPSSSAAAVAMDVVDALRGQHNSSNNHYQSNPSYHHHHHQAHSHSMDEDELRRYIVASPMSQSSAGDTGGSAAGINLHALFGSSSSAGQQHNAQYGQMQQQPASAPPPSSTSPASSSAASLETALAALGEQGRQQLLAILQLANSGAGASTGQQQQQEQHQHQHQTNSNNVHQQPAPHPPASSSIPSQHHQPPSASNDGFNFPLNLFGQATAHGSGQQGQGQGPGSSSNHSSGNSPASNSSNGNNISNNNNAVNAAIAAALSSSSTSASAAAAAAAAPGAFYSNAFRQYSAFPMMSQSQQQQQHISASTPASASNSSAKPSPALSAISHSHSHSQSQSQQSLPPNAIHFTAPTGTASTGNYANTGHSSSYQQQSHLQQQHHQGLPSSSTTASSSGADNSSHINNNSLGGGFSLPDANLFRSPAVFGSIPGTSSSAFYSDNGNGDDTDLLFTPLMSPALTASTQPGPSVGPLPESFANLTTQQFQQKYPDSLGMSQGVAPMTVFSPLTSPALRPQQGSGAGGSNNNGNGNGIKSSSGGSSGSLPATASSTPATSPQRSTHTTGKIRGASKNNAKTRPSPIIRPTIDTSVNGNGNGGMQSTGAHGSSAKALSRTSSVSSTSKRHTQSAAPTPLMMSTSTFGGQNQSQSQSQSQGHGQGQGYHGSQPYQHVSSRQSSSVPASPAFYATHMNMNMSNNSSSASVGGGTPNSGHSAAVGNGASSSNSKAASGNSNVSTNSQLGKLHETVAQTAVQNSPSPHQFDLSGLMPAYAAMVAQGQSASYPYSAQLPYGQQMQQPSQQQQYSHGQPLQQQQQPQSYQAQLPSNALSGSTSGSLEDLMSLPSPLDLNNILSMLGQNNSFAQTSGADGSMSNAYGASDASSGFATGLGNSVQQSAMQDSLRGMDRFMKDQSTMYQQQQQQQQQQAPRGTYHPHHQHSTSDSSVSAATAAFLGPPAHGHNVGAEQVQQLGGAKPGPLTPASFMNLPANQYTVLAGLLADHQPQNGASSATVQHQDGSAVSSTTQKSGKSDLAGSAKSKKQIDKIGTSKAHSSKTGQESKKKASQSKLATLNEDQTDAVMESSDVQPPAPSPEEMRLAINSNSTAPVSPALLAQNIKQVAAAAIAAKDAKSRARGRGNARRKSTIGGQQQQTLLEEDADVKPLNLDKSTSSKKQSVNGTPVLSPEKPFSHDESAAPSVYGESRPASTETSPMLAAQTDTRKSSHKIAEQRRRDSLKLCFEELRFILPPINPDEDEDFNGGPGSRRPGENNVGGQRGKNYTVDPKHPNRGISKVALLRKSNEYVTKLHDRVDRRDAAIRMLREELRLCRVALGQGKPGDDKALDGLSNVDFDDLEQDNDQIPPTYRLHGLHAPGSKLSLSAMFFEPSERTIEEDDREDMEEDQDEDGDDNDDEEYKAKRPRKKAGASSKANTRNTAKANVSA